VGRNNEFIGRRDLDVVCDGRWGEFARAGRISLTLCTHTNTYWIALSSGVNGMCVWTQVHQIEQVSSTDSAGGRCCCCWQINNVGPARRGSGAGWASSHGPGTRDRTLSATSRLIINYFSLSLSTRPKYAADVKIEKQLRGNFGVVGFCVKRRRAAAIFKGNNFRNGKMEPRTKSDEALSETKCNWNQASARVHTKSS
jgi:hypothetical protein